jgi:protein involved in polysaccharide export with SLBB domain
MKTFHSKTLSASRATSLFLTVSVCLLPPSLAFAQAASQKLAIPPGMLTAALAQAQAQAPAATTTTPPEPPPPPYPETKAFGGNLFRGNFASESIAAFNPDHIISIGNVVSVKTWGMVEFAENLTVDEQGNIFLPRVGPIRVQGVKNSDITKVIEAKVRTIYSGNLSVYSNLAVAQPVKIFVTGAVRAPGVYSGTSSDSVLRFLDRAHGIDPNKGSFLHVDIVRRGEVLHRYNLYSFIQKGALSEQQFLNGDTILVHPRQNTVAVSGLVLNDNIFEFSGASVKGDTLLSLAAPVAEATHVTILRKDAGKEQAEYLTLEAAREKELLPGDTLTVLSDRKRENMGIRIEGEHAGEQVIVVSYNARLKDVLKQVKWLSTSQREGVQLFRQSVKEAQRESLRASLGRLEKTILTSQSSSTEEAKIRAGEAEVFLKWIEKARQFEPLGQVVLGEHPEEMLLEPGDVLRIPRVSSVVMVDGEVNFPSNFAYDSSHNVNDYIEMAGGYNDFGSSSRILIMRPNGMFAYASTMWLFGSNVYPGDRLVVLPEVKTKYMQIAKDVSQIIYQMAVSTGVVLRIL